MKTIQVFLLAVFIGLGTVGTSTKALAYDIDCKIILCLPAGFPSGCGDAFSTFIDRITSVPPRPPIGFCPMGSIRDVEMHDSHPERLDVMNDVIDQEAMEATLRSVRVDYFASRQTCCSGRECDSEYPCTFTYRINGDGSGFRHQTIYGHHTGSKVQYDDLTGRSCIAGNSRSWVPPRQECSYWGRDEDTFCWDVEPGYWKRNATCEFGN